MTALVHYLRDDLLPLCNDVRTDRSGYQATPVADDVTCPHCLHELALHA